MPPNPIIQSLVHEWLAKAGEDYGVAEFLLTEASPYLTAIAYHAQQAAEKYLKAYLTHHQCEFRKTHDIEELLDIVAGVDKTLANDLREAGDLTPYGVHARYPGDFPDVSSEDAKRMVVLADLVRDRILAVLHSR